jgi:hypothetical protein
VLRRAAIVALLAGACARLSGADAPRLASIEPTGAYAGNAVDVRLTGMGFQARGVQHLEGGRAVSADFTVRIGAVALTSVRYTRGADGTDVLEAHAPADLPTGVHDVTVVDPYGFTGVLPGAFTVSDRAPPLVSVSLSAPAQVETGTFFSARAQLSNAGGVDARIVSLAVNGVDAGAAGQTVSAAGALEVDVPMQLAARGSADLALRAVLVDTVTGLPFTVATAGTQVLALSPPALAAALDPLPASVDVGQQFPASLTVSNSGDADAASVTPSLAAGSALAADPVAPQDVPAGQSRTWVLPLRGTASALAQVEVVAAGLDALTGATLATSALSPPIAVQLPAHLRVLAVAAPAVVSVGQEFRAAIEVENDGEATALAIGDASPASALTTWTSAPPPQPLGGAARAVFGWTVRADAPGPAQLDAKLAGIDANNSAAVALWTTLPVQIQTAAALGVDLAVPAQLSTGQKFAVVETVRNAGEAGVAQLALPPPDCGPDAVLRIAPALPAALGGGASAALSWEFEAVAAGPLGCSAGASGTDANSGQAVQASAAGQGSIQSAAALSAALPAAPAVVSRGQDFTVSVTVTNAGAAMARGVTASLSAVPAGGAGLTLLSAPAASDIAGGGTATFTWACAESGSAAGALGLTASFAGADANSGAALIANSPEASTAVQERAALAMRLQVPRAVDRGQTFAVVAAVTNTGGATARAVQPTAPQVTATGGAAASTTSAPAPADIAAGATASFSFTFVENGTAPGALSFSASAAGSDANSGASISVSATSPDVPVTTPAALAIGAVTVAPSIIDRGQAFTLTATVTNTGQAAAAAVTMVPAMTASGGADATTADSAGTVGLAGGASFTFSWNFVESGTAPGALVFTVTATGTDANSGAALSAQSTRAAVTVQAPAALSASLSVPPLVSLGDTVAVTLTVSNGGDATALSVQPGPLGLAGTAAVTVLATPAQTSATLAGGATTTFNWTLSAGSAGTLQVTTPVTGTDANDGTSLAATASASRTVQPQPESTLISTDPFAADGTDFSYLFSYQGMLYAGPNKSGTAAVRMAPDGTGATAVNWKLEVDTNLLNPARNGAYQTPLLAPACHTVGALGCAQNTTACGPDNEGGRAVFTSGTVNGTEWYLITGTSPIGGSRYAYLTNGSFPLASGGFDDLAFVQIAAGQGGSARMMSAARFSLNQLFLGFYDAGGATSQPTAPVLNALRKMPSLPGYQATGVSDLVNLNGVNLPAVGAAGIPANSGHQVLMVDSLRDLNGSLYVANNGGIARSVGSPSPCAAPGCANWANATPSAPAWAALSSVTVDSTVLGALEPSRRAVPAMVVFGGRLFAARNTTAGPQLWSCDPSLGTDALQCEPGDWSLVAPNTSGDSRLSQLNDPGNTAIALLVATASHLYLGFDNASGLTIYRTQLPSAAGIADFTGHQGCTAGQGGCTGLGGSGLGAALSRIFDGHAFTYAGTEWVYVSAGTGSAGPRLFRLAP